MAALAPQTRTLIRVHLKLTATADFRRGIPFHVAELQRQKRFPDLNWNDVVLLVSQTGLSLAFVFRPMIFDGGPRRGDTRAVTHMRSQLDASTPWNRQMLQEYAKDFGMEIINRKQFDEYFDARVVELREKRKENA